MTVLKKIEFGEIVELRKEKFNPETSIETRPCLELEHFEQFTGKVNGYVPSSEQKSIKNVFYKGDILFGKLRPYLRKYWLAEFDGVCSSEVWVLIPKSNQISNEYLFNLIQTNDFIQAANVSSGSKMPRADWEYIASFPVLIINSKTDQNAIVQVLSIADAFIQTTEKLVAQKELRKKWLLQQLLSGKKRLKGYSGVWKKCSASDFFCKRNEQAPNNGNIPLFSLTIENGITEKSDRYEREFLVKDKSVKNYKIAYPNDIVFNPANLRWGAIAKNSRNFKVLLSPIYEVLSVKNNFDINFISYLVSSPRQIAYYSSILEGTLIERMAVKVEPFLAIKYKIPAKQEQVAIAQVLLAADKEIFLLKTKVKKLKELKKGLMQQLLTGKVRLKIN